MTDKKSAEHFKVSFIVVKQESLWTALNVFPTHLGGNRRWVPLSFENNNNKKRYRAHKFYFTISSAVSSIQLHSRANNHHYCEGNE